MRHEQALPRGPSSLEELDAELSTNGAAAGRELSFSAAERQLIAMAADALDRRVELAAEYDQIEDVADRIKLSREIRLQETAVQRFLSKVSTAAPREDSLRTIKARAAVNARWNRGNDL